MKKIFRLIPIAAMAIILGCNSGDNATTSSSGDDNTPKGGQENVNDTSSQKDIVKIAASSKDFTTLVAAVKQADRVTTLSNAGPFTVFAPTNDAFNKLPAGTVEGLMKDDKKTDLQNILEYHVYVGVLKAENLTDGQSFEMVNGDKVAISVKDGKITLNGSAHVIASVPAANGIIHVIDAVLLPPAKK
jgi:uncharacterized surface protein with fasciclin (FAS1) repeats